MTFPSFGLFRAVGQCLDRWCSSPIRMSYVMKWPISSLSQLSVREWAGRSLRCSSVIWLVSEATGADVDLGEIPSLSDPTEVKSIFRSRARGREVRRFKKTASSPRVVLVFGLQRWGAGEGACSFGGGCKRGRRVRWRPDPPRSGQLHRAWPGGPSKPYRLGFKPNSGERWSVEGANPPDLTPHLQLPAGPPSATPRS